MRPLADGALAQIMPYAREKAALYAPLLDAAMREFDINTPARQASFLSQVGHESGQLRYVRELASGAAYEGRKDLGNTKPGDGVRYKGRGLIQVTGRANYTAAMMALDIDCVEHPELLEIPVNACRSAGWFWKTHGLNELADAGKFERICRIINGGLNGFNDRMSLYQKACGVLNVKIT